MSSATELTDVKGFHAQPQLHQHMLDRDGNDATQRVLRKYAAQQSKHSHHPPHKKGTIHDVGVARYMAASAKRTVRVTAYINGKSEGGVPVSASTWSDLLAVCRRRLELPRHVKRIFNAAGEELHSIDNVERDASVFVSTGERFKVPACLPCACVRASCRVVSCRACACGGWRVLCGCVSA